MPFHVPVLCVMRPPPLLPQWKRARPLWITTPATSDQRLALVPAANYESLDKMDERKDKTFGGRHLTASARYRKFEKRAANSREHTAPGESATAQTALGTGTRFGPGYRLDRTGSNAI